MITQLGRAAPRCSSIKPARKGALSLSLEKSGSCRMPGRAFYIPSSCCAHCMTCASCGVLPTVVPAMRPGKASRGKARRSAVQWLTRGAQFDFVCSSAHLHARTPHGAHRVRVGESAASRTPPRLLCHAALSRACVGEGGQGDGRLVGRARVPARDGRHAEVVEDLRKGQGNDGGKRFAARPFSVVVRRGAMRSSAWARAVRGDVDRSKPLRSPHGVP